MTVRFAIVFVLSISYASGDGDIIGKLTVGYQGSFGAYGDGAPLRSWGRWTNSDIPRPNATMFEIYPDLREYKQVYPTGYASLGNGRPARLFSSWDFDTVDVHFKWMKENNIDVAALQRFGNNAMRDIRVRLHYNGIATRVRNAAEKNNRKFFIMWDTTSWDNFDREVLSDLNVNLAKVSIFNSTAYAYQNGKPVIGVWGLGMKINTADPDKSLEAIKKLKSLGFYVIGGVPTYWRQEIYDSREHFRNLYLAFDMLQPFTVGPIGSVASAKQYINVLKEDYALVKQHKIDFQPVAFPGFSYYNMNHGTRPKNQIPRMHGDLMWQLFVNIRSLGINTSFVAMFDGYDDGSAIAKSAEDKFMIPTDQYFLTMDADGVHVSSDFYLRLVADGNRMLQGKIPLQQKLPTKFVV